jgi:hypothetical protein
MILRFPTPVIRDVLQTTRTSHMISISDRPVIPSNRPFDSNELTGVDFENLSLIIQVLL